MENEILDWLQTKLGPHQEIRIKHDPNQMGYIVDIRTHLPQIGVAQYRCTIYQEQLETARCGAGKAFIRDLDEMQYKIREGFDDELKQIHDSHFR